MTRLIRKPVPMTTDEIAETLHRLAEAIRAGDSFEGSFEYLLPGEESHEGDDGRHCPHLMVQAAFRVGNRDFGQGFMEHIGEYVEVEP